MPASRDQERAEAQPSAAPLAGQTAIVTGAAGGLGRAITWLLARRGAAVVLVDKDGDRLHELSDAIAAAGHPARTVVGDLGDPAVPDAIRDAALAWTDRIDVLVNNAGAGSEQVPLWEIRPDDWERNLAVNLSSFFYMCRAIVPVMISAGYGRVVNMASMAGKDGAVHAAAYAAAKAGVIGLTKTLGKECARSGVLVNAITPSLMDTDLLKADWFRKDVLQKLLAGVPMGRIGQPEEVAELVGFLASEQLSYSTGAVYDISGGVASY